MVTYDGRSSDSQRQLREAAQARRDELGRFQELVDRMPTRAKLRVTLTGEAARTLGQADAERFSSGWSERFAARSYWRTCSGGRWMREPPHTR